MPADSRATVERILAAGARLFAEHGYDGVSLRKIADASGAHIGLIHYHFGKKEELFRAIWRWRYTSTIENRNARIQTVGFDRDRAEVLAEIVDLFVLSFFKLWKGSGRDFIVILCREVHDPKEQERGVLRDLVDPNAQPLFDGLKQALPHLSPQALAWGYQAMVGAIVYHVMDVDRTTRLSKGIAVSGDTDAAYPKLRDFIVGGWLRLDDMCRQERQPGAKGSSKGRKVTRNSAPVRGR